MHIYLLNTKHRANIFQIVHFILSTGHLFLVWRASISPDLIQVSICSCVCVCKTFHVLNENYKQNICKLLYYIVVLSVSLFECFVWILLNLLFWLVAVASDQQSNIVVDLCALMLMQHIYTAWLWLSIYTIGTYFPLQWCKYNLFNGPRHLK